MTKLTEEKYYLSLYKEIQKVKSAFQTEHMESVEIFDVDIERRRGENQHLLDLQQLKFDANLLNRLTLAFLPILESYKVFDQEENQRFSDKFEKLNSGELAGIVLRKDWQSLKSFSTKHQLGTDFLFLVGLNLVQAVLKLYAEKLKSKTDAENWLKGECPVCGNSPALGKLRKDDGRRVLWCGWCGTEWYYKRIMCPFCGNEDHNTLRFFLVEEGSASVKDGFRVDVCDKCKRYVKTLDERKKDNSEKSDLYMENLNTVYLDVLAQKDGYQSPTYWMVTLSFENPLF